MLHVFVGDCVDAAVVLRAAFGKRVALLNMASDSNPGGGWQSGAGAQEVNFVSNRSVFDMQIPNYQQLFYNFRTNKIIYHKSIDITHTHSHEKRNNNYNSKLRANCRRTYVDAADCRSVSPIRIVGLPPVVVVIFIRYQNSPVYIRKMYVFVDSMMKKCKCY
jgi:hypothetical protein